MPAGPSISLQVSIPTTPPTADTTLVEVINLLSVIDPDNQDGTSWVVRRDGVVLDNYIHPGYGSGYTVQVTENNSAMSLGTYSFNYATGRLTLQTARPSTASIRIRAYRPKIINPSAADTVQQISAFGREATVGTSKSYARADHQHGSPADPVPVHAGDKDVHHKTNHDHSTTVENRDLKPYSAEVTNKLIVPKKGSGSSGAEVMVSTTNLRFMTDEVTPVVKTVKNTGDVVTATEHGDQGSSSGARHNYAAIDGTHGSGAHNTGIPVNVTKSSADEGASSNVARSDHKHDITTGTPGSVSVVTAAEGISTSLARSDHVHSVTTTTPSNVGTTNQAGTSSSLVRADHVHAHPSGLGANLHHTENHNTQHSTGGPDDLGGVNMGITGNWDVTGTTGRIKVQTGAGSPNHSEAEGTLYWDTTNDHLYGNNNGSTGWTKVGGISSGTLSAKPAASSLGQQYYVTDLGVTLFDDGTSWQVSQKAAQLCEFFEDDFVVAPLNASDLLNWHSLTASGGSVGMVNGGEGAVALSTSSTANSLAALRVRSTNSNHIALNDRFIMIIRARASLSTSGQCYIGLGSTLPTGIGLPTDGIVLAKTGSAGNWNVTKITSGASSGGVALGTGTGYILVIIERLSSSITYYLTTYSSDAAVTGSHTVSLPTAGAYLQMAVKNGSDAVNNTCDVDYVGLWAAR